MTNLNEFDLQVIKWIQELKSCKVAQATDLYRQYAKKLADPDHAQRHEIIWESIQRGAKPAELSKISDSTKEKKAMPEKKPRAKKAAKAKVESVPRPVVELADLTREVELTPVGGEFKYVYTANLFGKKHSVVVAEIDHSKGAEDRFGYIPVSIARLKQAVDFASANDKLPVAIAAIVRVKGRLDQGYAVPRDVFEEFKLESKHALTLSGKARLAYREKGWDGVKFSVAKTEAAAA